MVDEGLIQRDSTGYWLEVSEAKLAGQRTAFFPEEGCTDGNSSEGKGMKSQAAAIKQACKQHHEMGIYQLRNR